MRVIVTGANRGIGREFARQLSARGDEVIATVRDRAQAKDLEALRGVTVVLCDVADDDSVRRFAASLPAGPIDLLINNAGVMGKMQALDELDLADMTHTFSVNALGPIRVTRAVLPRLLQSSVRKIVHITSKMGSIADNTSGGAYGYRMSKAALNMASRSMALDLEGQRVISVVFNPGWVQTDMGGHHAPTPVQESVANMLKKIDQLTAADSGRFFNHTGEEVPF